ncbi:MAG: hypothetical protein JSV20_07530 [Candidatus Bathyarchaeota archaeon]|nr:MAG: hypothetical protein JSV20_07530 [Candidatus Bathyarchaeota archaeon]
MGEKQMVPLIEAREQVEIAITRLALLHLAFSKTLIEKLGDEKGNELILKSIMEYGKRIGDRITRGLPDLPKYGIHRSRRNGKVFGCVLAEVFQEYGEEDVGCLYCYVDAAKSMATNPKRKLIHGECAACGDEYCSFKVVPTTEKEQRDFKNRGKEWKYVDPRLAQKN